MLSHYVRRLGASAAVALMLGLGFGESAWAQPLSVNLQDQPAITSTMAMRSVMLGVARAGDRLVAVGERGFIIISDDNGGSWRQVSSPVSVTLVRVRFVDPHNGWAVGHAGVVLHSTDGGLTWSRQLDGVEGARIELAAAKEASAKSEDSEAAEERVAQAQQLVDDGADKPLLDLLFFNDKEGMVVGAYGLAFSTHDAGQTWQSLRGEISNPSGLHLYGLSQVGGAIYIVGEQGILLRSEDGARTFQSLTSPYEGTSFGLASTTGGSLILFGLRGNAFESSDHGTTWRRLDTLQPTTLTTSLELRDGSVLLADESGRVVRFNGTDAKAEVMPLPVSGYFSGLMTAANGDLVISSARGMLTSTTPSEITKAVK